MIHKVIKPFMCREGQFGKGRKLVIGISQGVISEELKKGETTHQFTIGKNPKVYKGDIAMITKEGYLWENNKGKSAFIIPVEYFDESS